MERMNRPVLSAERRLPAADFLERVRAALVGLVDARGLALEARVRRGGSIGLDGLEAAVSRGVELADKFGRTRVASAASVGCLTTWIFGWVRAGSALGATGVGGCWSV